MVNQLNISLKNTTSSTVYAYITGRAPRSDVQDGVLCLLQADGKTPYFPQSPPVDQAPLAVDCTIRLGPPGSNTVVTIPQLSAARIWFSLNIPLVFRLNRSAAGSQSPGLVEPSVANPSDPNINTNWGFCEFTLNDFQLFANISYVDFVSLPISMALTNLSGQTQVVKGIPKNGLENIARALISQNAIDNAGWDKLIVKSPSGQILRILSPNLGQRMDSSILAGYFEPYVDLVWNKYTNTPLTVDTQAAPGVVQGKVSGNKLLFPGVGEFTKPGSRDILTCDSGPFLTNTPGMRALTPRIAAAFNRSTLLSSSFEPANPADAYLHRITNHYSRIVHENNIDRRGYAFPYDDVNPSGGSDQSGSAADQNPSLLTIVVGGSSGFDARSRIQAESFDQNNGVLTEPTNDIGGGNNVGWIKNGDWIGFNNVSFIGTGLNVFVVRVASGAATGITGTVQLVLDNLNATPVATFNIQGTGGWQIWRTVTTRMNTRVTGTHTVYLKFASSQEADFVNVNWFTFQQATAPPPALPTPPTPPAVPTPAPSGRKYKSVAYFVNWVRYGPQSLTPKYIAFFSRSL